MFDWLQQIEFSREIQWFLLALGGLGFLLNTVLFRWTIWVGLSLLELEIVRDSRQRNTLFAKSCDLYERSCRKAWMRFTGLLVSSAMIGAAMLF